MDGTSDEDEFSDSDTGRVDIVVIARRVWRWVVVGVAVGLGVFVWMYIPPKIPSYVVAVVNVVITLYRPTDGDGRTRRLGDTVIESKTHFAGAHWVVHRPVYEGFETLEFRAKVVECSGVDSAPQRVRFGLVHRVSP